MFRCQIRSGGYYMNHEKVKDALESLLIDFNKQIPAADNAIKQHHLAFDFHFNLVTIHPFGDENGRTSRLMMNYIQMIFRQPLSIINVNDKNEYIISLMETREKKDMNIFRRFMENQHIKHLSKELELYKKSL